MLNFSITLILFSLLEVSSKPLMFFLDPVILTFYRFLLGLLTMIAFAYHKNILSDLKKISYSDFKILSVLGIINIALAMSSLQLAVKYSNAATAAVIFCSNPFFVFIFSILSKSEKFNLKCFSGVVLGIAGVVLVMSRHGFHISHGALFAVMASMLFAFYIIVNKKVSANCRPVIVNIVSFFAGLAVTAAYLLISAKGLYLPSEIFTSYKYIMILLFLGIAVSGFGYITFINTIKKYTPISASVIFLLKPALATIFSLVFLGEKLGALFYYGLFLIMSGSWLILSSKYYKTN